jgi:AcrR family transcriptional regulator
MRTKSPETLPAIAEAALAAFTSYGYRQTQMADVARRLSMSAGNLYLYVEGKEALFELAMRCALGEHLAPERLPFAGLGRRRRAAFYRERIVGAAQWPLLRAALVGRAELADVLGELFDGVAKRRRLIWLLDRCAWEIAELRGAFADEVKRAYIVDLTRYVAKTFPAEAPAEARARAVMEMVVWMAAHRHRDPVPPAVDEAAARSATIALGVAALARGSRRE